MQIPRIILTLIPKRYLGYLVGRLVRIRLPRPAGPALVRWFVRRYGIDLSEATKAIDGYPTIGALFIRELKPGARPLGAGLVSPIDGTLRNCGTIDQSAIWLIKDTRYNLVDIVRDESLSKSFDGGVFANLYLAPKDYHRVHAPESGVITECRYVPGKLWPVNDWSIRSVRDLFAVNERVITVMRTEHGMVAVIMIGATNVGKIILNFAKLPRRVPADGGSIPVTVDRPKIGKGDELGRFEMGSAVLLLAQPGVLRGAILIQAPLPRPVRWGESLVVSPQHGG